MAKRKIPDLVVEYASDSGSLYYLSVIEYRRQNYLCVIDNITSEEIGAYVLDFAQQERINLRDLMQVITLWFYKASTLHPLSFEFSKIGISPVTNRIYKSFELPHVTRLIGNDFRFDFESSPKIRRRRIQMIPSGAEIHLKRSSYTDSVRHLATTPQPAPQAPESSVEAS